jgi:toxin YoeB
MEIIFSPQSVEDLNYWKKSGDIAVQKRISLLLADILKHPYSGIGKPEPLKYQLSGKWSRRINSAHRLVYIVSGKEIWIETLRGHY